MTSLRPVFDPRFTTSAASDPPRAERVKGNWPVYRVNDAAVTALYLRLGQELGEI